MLGSRHVERSMRISRTTLSLGIAGKVLTFRTRAWSSFAPDAALTAWLALGAGLIQFWRLGRWAGERAGQEPLVAILHIGYLFVPIGFALLALGILRPDIISSSGALHAWTAGAVGTMTLAVMTRASLGHTGQPLTATRAVQTIYVAVIFSALARIVAGFGITRDPMLHLSGAAWIFAFAGFATVFGPRSRAEPGHPRARFRSHRLRAAAQPIRRSAALIQVNPG
jgi:uncharacterized protein involved in response to NO